MLEHSPFTGDIPEHEYILWIMLEHSPFTGDTLLFGKQLVSSPDATVPHEEKQSGETSRISWASGHFVTV